MPYICLVKVFAEIRSFFHQYLVCDTLLLFQIYYYRWKNPHADEVITQGIEPAEDTPLLVNPKRTSRWRVESEVLKYSLCVVFVFAAGLAAWAIDSKIRGSRPPSEPESIFEWESQLLGWASAALFCTSSTASNFAFRFTHPPMSLQWALAYHKSVSNRGLCWNPLLIHTFHSEER